MSQNQIDPRGPRFTASVTLALFAIVLLTAPGATALVLLAVQTACFAIGAGRGVQFTPTAYVFKNVVRPRLAPPAHLEDPRPPRFAQTVGLVFSAVALAAFATGVDPLGFAFAAFAFVAAFLNAVFGYCLGCEMYLLIQRTTRRIDTTTPVTNKEEVDA